MPFSDKHCGPASRQGASAYLYRRVFFDVCLAAVLVVSTALPAPGQDASRHPVAESAAARAVPNPENAAKRARAGEPRFSPRPGWLAGETHVTLVCPTAGSEIHYTVDGSQPTLTSPVYHAAITVSGTALTIKAFAAADGRKDSAVVTGTYLIRE